MQELNSVGEEGHADKTSVFLIGFFTERNSIDMEVTKCHCKGVLQSWALCDSQPFLN